MKILAVSGSLRAASLNSVQLFANLGDLPLFNPDIEMTDQPVVARFRAQLLAADVVLIASPEYAHDITGAMKNALDWMVGSEVFVNKPVALLNASPRAVHAQASLKEIITMMSTRVVEEASITLPILGANLDEEGIVTHPAISVKLRQMLTTLQAGID